MKSRVPQWGRVADVGSEQSCLITAEQLRTARRLLNWAQSDLADRIGVSVPVVAGRTAADRRPTADRAGNSELALRPVGRKRGRIGAVRKR